MTSRFDPNQMHFFYNGEYLGSCEPGDAWCPKLLLLMGSDADVATSILGYMNSLGDPVFPVSEEDWGTPETDITKVDIEDLYNAFMLELDFEYKDFPDDFYVGGDYRLPGFEIFVGPVAEENVVESATEIIFMPEIDKKYALNLLDEWSTYAVDTAEKHNGAFKDFHLWLSSIKKLSDYEIKQVESIVFGCTDVSAKRYIKSFTADDLKAQLGSNYPKGGYLYVFKHGIGPGTIPNDVKVVKVKDLPNYYTAVWLDRFLTDEELKQYDIPDETRINDYLGRIGYCKKNGDVVPCEDITASTMSKPTVDSVLQMIADKKIIFKNDVAYWSKGKGVLPKEYRDCIAQTEYAHWINEWSCEQAEKYGSRAYYEYDGEAEVDSCSDIKAATEPNAPDANKSKLVRQVIKQAKEIRDYFQSHNNNLNRRQEQFLEDLSDGIDSRSIVAIREAIENLKYNSKNMRNEQYYLIEDLYNEFNFADGKFEGMGRPGSEDVDACTAVKAYSYTHSRKRCTNVTDEVLEYTKDAYPALHNELESKDIWVSIWSDGEYSLSYNSIKNPDNFLSDSVKQDFMQAMEDLFPGSFWGDLVDIDACSEVMASTSFKYADKVKFEDIFPSEHDVSFFFTSDDVAYAKELLGDVPSLTGFSIQVSLPKDYNGDWQEALIYISPKTSDGHGGESDSDWTDITFDISDADMQSLVEQSWDEYKKRGWNDPDTKVTGSTKYFANMVSASADDDGFEQLVDGPDNDTDEYIEYGKYYVAGYLRSTYRGLMSDLYSEDFEEILSAAADMAGQGLYIEITNRADGRSMRYTPEDFEVAAEYGEYPDHIREDLAL